MTRLFDTILGRTRVLVPANERALYLTRGRLQGILEPGEYTLDNRRNTLEVETHNLARPEFTSPYEKALFDTLPEVVAKHFTEIRTGAGEAAIVERDGRVYTTLGPDTRLVLWTVAGPWTVTKIDTRAEPMLPEAVMRRLIQARQGQHLTVIAVGVGQCALVYIDGVLRTVHEPGLYAYWDTGLVVTHRLIDLKRQTIDVTGQEVLTLDRVTIRLNIAADYQVVDPVKAASEVKDFADALYRALQAAFRRTIGALKLDQILERKGVVDAEAGDKVRSDMEKIGIRVDEIILKDVILPGDMRDILNKVVAAEKEAEANVIRRREETNATRSLLNTARVMAENPVMLRLKELEALESIAGKVDRLTVHNGTDGLMNDLVRLRDGGAS